MATVNEMEQFARLQALQDEARQERELREVRQLHTDAVERKDQFQAGEHAKRLAEIQERQQAWETRQRERAEAHDEAVREKAERERAAREARERQQAEAQQAQQRQWAEKRDRLVAELREAHEILSLVNGGSFDQLSPEQSEALDRAIRKEAVGRLVADAQEAVELHNRANGRR